LINKKLGKKDDAENFASRALIIKIKEQLTAQEAAGWHVASLSKVSY
jgi:hypothetical protein